MYETDDQLSEALHAWVIKNKNHIIIFIVVLFGSVSAYQAWTQHENKLNLQAANLFNTTIKSLNNNKIKIAHKNITIINNDYKNTVYSNLTAFIQSKDTAKQNTSSTSVSYLKHIISQSNQPALKDIARLKLARIYLNNNQTAKAQSELEAVSKIGKSNPITSLLLGDVYVQNNSFNQAIKAYSDALELLNNINQDWHELQQYISAKLNDATKQQNIKKNL